MCKIFEDNWFNITLEINLHITEYLDATFNLKTGKYYPYREQNNSLQYIHEESNHPSSIIKQIPFMMANGCLTYPAIKSILKKLHQFIYTEALKNSGFNGTLKFFPTIPASLQDFIEEEKLFGSTHHLAVMLKQM